MHSQPPPQGSLEELFRHHLLESEAAAVPPRPLVWEHIDNSLLLAQNEKYRRRLLVYRRSLAASLLLAALAGGGWWHSQRTATATLASANAQHEAARRAVAGAVAPGARPTAPATLATLAASQPGASLAAASSAAANQARTHQTTVLANSQAAPATAGRAGYYASALAATTTASLAGHGRPVYAAVEASAQGEGSRLAGAQPARTRTFSSPNASAIAATTTSLVDSPGAQSADNSYTLSAADPQPAEAASEMAATALADGRLGEEALTTRLTALAVPPAAGLPAELAMKELPAPTPTLLRRWRYGAEYAIGAFQPNIDFNRSASDYNNALGYNTVSLTRAAAAEYRANLRAGLSQRLTLRATRWLGGHWSLNTGVSVAQQDAYSATSAAFTGEQLADLSSFSAVASSTTNAPSRDSCKSREGAFAAGLATALKLLKSASCSPVKAADVAE